MNLPSTNRTGRSGVNVVCVQTNIFVLSKISARRIANHPPPKFENIVLYKQYPGDSEYNYIAFLSPAVMRTLVITFSQS